MSDLNAPQKEAAEYPGKPLLIVAGPGAGKTKTLVSRIAHLIATGTPPSRLLATTFTNKAADEIRERVQKLVNVSGSFWIGTFHSVCARLLRVYGSQAGISRDFVIYDDDDSKKLMESIIKDLQSDADARAVLAEIDHAKNNGIDPDAYAPDDPGNRVKHLYAVYEQRLQDSNAVDFGGLLCKALDLCKSVPDMRSRFDHVLVDEFQDVCPVQAAIAKELSRGSNSVTVVGDDSQSVYSWRGADVTVMLNFTKDYPNAKIIKLEENYRSTEHILNVAASVISKNKERIPKKLFTRLGKGEKVTLYEGRNQTSEAMFVANTITKFLRASYKPSDIAVLFRTNAQSRALEEVLRTRGIHYKILGGVRFYDRMEIKNVLGYLRAIQNKRDTVAFHRILNVPARGIGKASLAMLDTLARTKQVGFLEGMREAADSKECQSKLRNRLSDFLVLYDDLVSSAATDKPSEFVRRVYTASKYEEELKRQNEYERIENVQEFIGDVQQYEQDADDPTIAGFLEKVALASSADLTDPKDAVQLLSCHSAKGREYEVVFIVGLEEDLLPHYLSIQEGNIEEERRLFFVAITRAKRSLFMSYVKDRFIFGKARNVTPSRFIHELSFDDITCYSEGA